MRRSAALISLAALAILPAACDDSTGPEEERVYLGSSVLPGPSNVLSAEVEVRAVGFDSVALRFGRPGEPPRRSPAYPFGADSLAYPAVLGMAPDGFYDAEVILFVGSGESVADTVRLSSGSLPAWIPEIDPVGQDTTPGFLILSLPDGTVIHDNSGTVVWYRQDPDPTLVNFQAHPSGDYTSFGLQNEVRAYRVLDELGRETGRIGCTGYEIRPHEIRIDRDGTRWVLCDDLRDHDLSPWGGSPDGQVQWTVIQRLSPIGDLEWEWHSADHFDVADGVATTLDGVESLNLTHGNSLDLDVDGNLLVSFRNLNEVTKIDAATGEVLWRFGGKRNEFTFVADPKGAFQRQHGLRVVGPGEIQMLDNSDVQPSRLLRYAMDESARTATLVWEFIDGPGIHTLVGGSTQVFEDGGGLVSFGREGRVVEVDRAGSRRWEVTGIEGLYVFRAERIPSLYSALRTGGP